MSQYCGHHELVSLSKDFGNALKNPRFADVTLRVGTDLFPVHRMVLMSRSKVFEKMFESDMKENKDNFVDIEDGKVSTVKTMLEYIYTGEIDALSMDLAIDLYAISDKYELLGLKSHSKKFIMKNIHAENMGDVAVLTDLYGDEELKTAAKRVLRENPKRIFESQNWRDFSIKNQALYSKLMESSLIDVRKSLEHCKGLCNE